MMSVLLFNLLYDSLNFLCLAIVDAQVILIVLDGRAHVIQRLSDFALFVGDQGLSEQAFSAGIVISTEFLTEPIQNDC